MPVSAVHVRPTVYPRARLCGLPPSPLAFVRSGFESLFASPERVAKYHQLFCQDLISTRKMRTDDPFGQTPYVENIAKFRQLILEGLQSRNFLPLLKAANMNFCMYTATPYREINQITGISAIEQRFLGNLMRYLAHDSSHASTSGIVNHGVIDFDDVANIRKEGTFNMPLPDIVFTLFNNYYQQMDQFALYADEQAQMAIDFFAPLSELTSSPAVTGEELPDFISTLCHAFALRFIRANFAVTNALPDGQLTRNTIYYHVDPSLTSMRLPKFLLGPKLVGNIKNGMRMVWAKEFKKEDAGQPNSLQNALNNEPVPNPVLYKVEALPITPRVWELRFSDNGNGILTNEIYKPLATACETHPESVSPALRKAVARWKKGDAFAFNQLPLEDMLEAVFQLGVSVGSGGSRGTGMGLWGSTMLLLKLGGQIKVGINPKTGGYFESVVLPMDLSVSPEEVARAANQYWSIH